MAEKKYLDLLGLGSYHSNILKNFTSDVTYTAAFVSEALTEAPTGWPEGYYAKEGNTYTPAPAAFTAGTYYKKTQGTDKSLAYTKYPSATFDSSTEAVTKGAASETVLFTVTDTVAQGSSSLITSGGVQAAIQGITEPMIFKGGATLTADSSDTTKCAITITDQTITVIKKGYTFKITEIASSPTYTGTLKVGDTLIAAKEAPKLTADWVENTDWVIVPSGDEPSGTVTSVGVEAASGTPITVTGSPITSSGTITLTHSNSGVTAGTYGESAPESPATKKTPAFGGDIVIPNVAVNATGHVTTASDITVTIPNTAADASTLGLVKIGDNITVGTGANAGVISVPIADTDNKFGVVKTGDNITNTNGVITATPATYDTESTPISGTVIVDADTLTLSSGVLSIDTITPTEVAGLFA